MKIVVCAKQVIDPEAPAQSFRIDAASNSVVPPQGVPLVINGFDEQAAEAALRIKDNDADTKITVLTMGPDGARDVIKHVLAMGADDAVHLNDPAFEGGDSFSVATALAAAIKKIGGADLILCGRQASDWDNGLVGVGIAELLGVPSVTMAKKVEPKDGKVRVERVIGDGYEVIESTLPAVVTVSNELGDARYPTMRGIMMAGRKPVQTLGPADIGVQPSQVGSAGRKTKLLKLFQPVRDVKCEIVEGESVAEAAEKLAVKLREAKLI